MASRFQQCGPVLRSCRALLVVVLLAANLLGLRAPSEGDRCYLERAVSAEASPCCDDHEREPAGECDPSDLSCFCFAATAAIHELPAAPAPARVAEALRAPLSAPGDAHEAHVAEPFRPPAA